MKKKYPTPHNSNFILCEDIRTESGNKLSFLGVFTGGNILLKRSSDAATSDDITLQSLAFFLDFFCETTDQYKLTIDVINPDKENIFHHIGEVQRKEADTKLLIIFKLLQFKVEKFGKYTIVVKFDETAFSNEFDILILPDA